MIKLDRSALRQWPRLLFLLTLFLSLPLLAHAEYVTVHVVGGGRVQSNVGGIDCAYLGPVCSASYNSGTTVTFTAIPDTEGRSILWARECAAFNGNTCTLALNGGPNKIVAAAFPYTASEAALGINLSGGPGRVVFDGLSIECGGDSISSGGNCVSIFPLNYAQTIHAEPSTGFGFVGWSGACSGNSVSCNLILSANRSVTAQFVQTATPPIAPSSLQAVKRYGNEIDLGWTDNSGNESGFDIEVRDPPAGPWTHVAFSGANTNFYPHTNLSAGHAYDYRLRSYYQIGENYIYSAYSSVYSTSTQPLNTVPDQAGVRLMVFTYPSTGGVPVPTGALDFFCNASGPPIASDSTTVLQAMDVWVRREANKYGVAKPYSTINCLRSTQVPLPDSLMNGNPASSYSLNEVAVRGYLETNAAVPSTVQNAIHNAKYVAVFHYYPSDAKYAAASASDAIDNKYAFMNFFPWPDHDPATATEFAPNLTVYQFAEPLNHEFMHHLGATDKYDAGSGCLIDPRTSRPYIGYDIMCHRITPYIGGPAGSIPPQYAELIVSEATAREVGWVILAVPRNFRLR